jgi:hypothetical protein
MWCCMRCCCAAGSSIPGCGKGAAPIIAFIDAMSLDIVAPAIAEAACRSLIDGPPGTPVILPALPRSPSSMLSNMGLHVLTRALMNQLLSCVIVKPVWDARSFFSSSLGYGWRKCWNNHVLSTLVAFFGKLPLFLALSKCVSCK